jgi:hypothetical protein
VTRAGTSDHTSIDDYVDVSAITRTVVKTVIRAGTGDGRVRITNHGNGA